MATVTPETPFRDLGDCSYETFYDTLNGTPVGEPGTSARSLYDQLRDRTRLYLGVSWLENKHHTTGILLPPWTKNNLSLRPRGYPEELGRVGTSDFARFSTYLDCAIAFLRRFTDPNLPYKDALTILDFARIYHPSGDVHPVTGGVNSAVLYAQRLCNYINQIPPMEVVVPNTPKIENIIDLIVQRKYGLTSAGAMDIIHSRIENRAGHRPEIICCHVQQGNTSGSLQHHARSDVQASATVYINQDGTIVQAVPEQHGPWTQGIKPGQSYPTAKGKALLDQFGVTDANIVCLSIEAEGWSDGPHPNVQLDSIVWQIREWQKTYPWIGNHEVVGHKEFDVVNRSFCPGRYLDEVTKRLGVIPPPPEPTDPLDLSEETLRGLFAQTTTPAGIFKYDPNGVVTKYWLAHPTKFRYAGLDQVIEGPTGRYFQFSQGPLLHVDRAGKLIEVA